MGIRNGENHRNQKHGSSSPAIKSQQSKQHQKEKKFTLYSSQIHTSQIAELQHAQLPIAQIKPKKIPWTEANHLIKQDHSIPK